MGNTIKVDGRTIGVTEFAQGAVLRNEVFVVTGNLFSEYAGLVNATVTVLDVTLQEGTFDVESLLTFVLLDEEFDGFDFLWVGC